MERLRGWWQAALQGWELFRAWRARGTMGTPDTHLFQKEPFQLSCLSLTGVPRDGQPFPGQPYGGRLDQLTPACVSSPPQHLPHHPWFLCWLPLPHTAKLRPRVTVCCSRSWRQRENPQAMEVVRVTEITQLDLPPSLSEGWWFHAQSPLLCKSSGLALAESFS